MLIKDGWHVQTQVLTDTATIGTVRDTLVAGFLETDASDMIMIDDDLTFPPDALQRLLAHDVDLVGGIYPFRSDAGGFAYGRLDDSLPDPDTGLLRVAVGLFTQEARDMPDGTRRLFSEDYSFCLRWGDLGGEVYADASLEFGHIGRKEFRRGSLAAYLNLTSAFPATSKDEQ
ncbi:MULTISPECIES: hypothetical protein [unclassified Mesorhizobium]|uniref:hypothetical protein n=1 Tax=unclassified Mesorhizobium TaxID=325217 RepID=UPI000FDB4DE4|nr:MULTISPECIES: hypothetical protein [unclassified Mesorhizobium]TGT69535.1 hypothetical protein EN809_024755 [Mesorhizobium sp. M2E.F.Ca.ET.166.01.1.1]TGW01867.1 hypothetical protein EN797_016250 [Mesorhizobium sp. M2E.F.Ca.ET.154.01.1.1]